MLERRPKIDHGYGNQNAPPSARTAVSIYTLKLYVAGQTPRTEAAIRNLRRICEQELGGRYDLEIIDVLEAPLERPDQGEADPLHDAWAPQRQRCRRHPRDHEQRSRRGEDPEADPAGIVATGVHVIQVAQQTRREDERDVHDDEQHEPAQHQEVQRPRDLYRQALAHGLEARRQRG